MSNAQTKDVSAVSAAVEAFRKAMESADRSALEKLVADELTYGHSTARLEDKAAFIEAAPGKGGFSAVELSDPTIKVVDNVAIVRHVLNGTRRDGGDKMKLAILMIWLRQHEQWKLVARQSVKV